MEKTPMSAADADQPACSLPSRPSNNIDPDGYDVEAVLKLLEELLPLPRGGGSAPA